MLTQEQTEQIKSQLFSQLDNSNVENKEEIKSSIQAMNSEQLEEFVKQNQQAAQGDQQCIFCSIVGDKIPSNKIDENDQSIAVLEINPISQGHVIIIPRLHSEEIPKQAFDLAEKISKKLSNIFKPKKVEIVESSMFGHKIINVFPIYNDETLHSQRTKATPKELESIQKQLQETEIEKQEPQEETELGPAQKPITEKNTWLPKRIP